MLLACRHPDVLLKVLYFIYEKEHGSLKLLFGAENGVTIQHWKRFIAYSRVLATWIIGT